MDTGTNVLNTQQRRAAEQISGALLVLAPVGTGKTTVLTQRLINALNSGLAPSQTLCLSFTNKAANEIRERVRRALPTQAREVTISTFHALCARIVRQEGPTLGIPTDFVIYDEEDAKQVLRTLVTKHLTGLAESQVQAFVDLLLTFTQAAKREQALSDVVSVPRSLFEQVYQRTGSSISVAHAVDHAALLRDYQSELFANHALDFADLIVLTARLFRVHPAALQRWQAKFRWLQVDEVQDTNPEEYAIIAQLARPHGNLAFFGDIDQTLYEWRGSDPEPLLAQFHTTFGPVTEVHLVQNYRATEVNVAACRAVIGGYQRAIHRHIEWAGREHGVPVCFHAAPTLRDEGRWIADEIVRLRQTGANGPIAVLTRAHFIARELSTALDERGLEHARIEQFPFYRRAEVKDALAYLRLLRNPYDAHSLYRVIQAPPSASGKAVHELIEALPADLALRLIDFANASTFDENDPYGLLLARLTEGRVVIFDVETTGTDVDEDEIIELAAVRVGPTGIQRTFHAYLTPSKPLGDSVLVHHYSEAFLRTKGQPPMHVLRRFLEFSAGCLLVGHNVAFDIGMLTSNAGRHGLTTGYLARYDTLDIARRLLHLERYRLLDVRNALGTPTAPDHSAVEDVKATWEVLVELLKPIRRTPGQRRILVQRYRPQFEPLARKFATWRTLAERLRPSQLLRQILRDSGFDAHLAIQRDAAHRLANLTELLGTLERLDDLSLTPIRALDTALNAAALGSDLDRYGAVDTRVRLLTVHQAKGMEFDTVFVAGAVDSFYPFYRARGDQRKLDEEHRVFYVAVSRARQRLYITHHTRDRWNRRQQLSRFAALIPSTLRAEGSPPLAKATTDTGRSAVQPRPSMGEEDLF